MAKLENYNGSIEVIAGFKQKNEQDYPLMEAHSVQIDETGKRLDQRLIELAEMGLTDKDKADLVQEVLESDTIANLNAEVFGTEDKAGIAAQIQDAVAATDEVKKDIATNLYQLAQDEGNSSIVYLYRDEKDAAVIPPDQEGTNVISTIQIVGGAGGGGGTKIVLDTNNSSPLNAISLYGKDAYIKFKYNFWSYDEEKNQVAQQSNCKAIWLVNGVEVANMGAMEQDVQHSFNVRKYLRSGSNDVILRLVGEYANEDGELVTKTLATKWVVNNIQMYVTSTFKDTNIQTGDVIINYTPYGNLEKTIYFELNGDKEVIPPVTTSRTDIPMQQRISSSLFSHGSHLLKIYSTATISDITKYLGNETDLDIKEDGTAAISGSVLVFDIMWAAEGETTPIIKCAYDTVTATQYNTYDFLFAVYTPGAAASVVNIAIDGKKVSTLTVEGTGNQVWSYRPTEIGEHTVTITSGTVSRQFKVIVEKMDIEIEEEVGSLKMDFNPIGRSNADENYDKFEYRPTEGGVETGEVYSMSVSDNFDWHNGGWQKDEKGESVFCVKAGTWMELNYPLFKAKTTVEGGEIDPVRKGEGKNFKLTFKTANCKDFDSDVMTCFLEGNTTEGDLGIEGDTDNQKSKGIGVVVKSQKATLSSSVKAMSVPFIEEQKIEFEVNLTNEDNYREILMLLDAEYSKGDIYDENAESFVQTTPQPIHFGSNDCDVYIYRFKAYDKSLTDAQIVNNHILEKTNSDEMISEYQRNQILEGQLISPEKLAAVNPDLRILKVTCDHFPTSKDAVAGCTVEMIYKNGRPEDNWTANDVSISGQGTSSMEYKTSALNFDIDVPQFNWVGEDGKNHYSTYYQMSENDIGENYFNVKVNVASSENANNACNADDYHNYQPYLRPCRQGGYMLSENLDGVELEAKDVSAKVRDTMKFYPVVIFVEETGSSPTYFAKTDTSQMYFYACGDFGNSKKNVRSFGLNPSNDHECIVEIANNDDDVTRFKTTDLSTVWTTEEGKGSDKGNGLEFRNIPTKANYKKETNHKYYLNWLKAATQRLWSWVAYTDTTAASNRPLNEVLTEFYSRINNMSEKYFEDVYDGKTIEELVAEQIVKIKTWGNFTEDTVDYRKAKFVKEFDEYFEPSSTLYHYVYTERHTMIDNRAKNVFPHTEDGIIWDLTFGYDMDTSKGNDNTGYLTYDFGVEDTDRVDNSNPDSRMAFNAADSVLWCNIRDLMPERVADAFASREGAGAWNANRLIDKFEKYQNVKPIRLVMTDMRMKYLRPYEWRMDGYSLVSGNEGYAPTSDFIPRMLGTKKYQRRYFEKYQEAYMSSKYAIYHSNSAAELDSIPLRIGSTAQTTVEIVPYAKMYVNLKMGNNTFNFRQKANKNEAISITLPSAGGDTEAEILSASLLKQLNNLSALKLRTISVGNAKRLQRFELGSDAPGYTNPNLTTVSFGTNTLLEYLDVRNCTALNALTGIEKCIGLKNLYTTGSAISNLVIADNGLLENAELNAVQVLWLKNLRYLTNLNLTSYTNLQSLILDNCPHLDSYYIVTQAKNLNTLRVTQAKWELESDELLSRLSALKGLDNNNQITSHSVLTGSVYVALIGQLELNNFKKIWGEPLTITYGQSLSPVTVTFVNWDNSYLYTNPNNPEDHGILITSGYKAKDPVAAGYFNTPVRPTDERFHYTFKGWSPSLDEPILKDTFIMAQYEETHREYTISWYRDETESSKITSVTAHYGQPVIYPGEIPTKTAAAGGFYYLFAGWDKYVPFVMQDERIQAVWEQATVPTEKKSLAEFEPAELYALSTQATTKLESYLTTDTLTGQSEIDIQLGYLPTYDGAITGIEEELIAQNLTLDGSGKNVIVTDINLFDEDKSWTMAIDYEFVWSDVAAKNETSSTTDFTLVGCFDKNANTGFSLYNRKNGAPRVTWTDFDKSSQTAIVGEAPTYNKESETGTTGTPVYIETYTSMRDMIVLRHVKGESTLKVYRNPRFSLEPMQISTIDSYTGEIPVNSNNIRLTLGGNSYYDSNKNTWVTQNYAKGKLYNVKVWHGDIGEDECKKIANWVYEKRTFQYAGETINYSLAEDENKKSYASFIAKDLLDGKMQMGMPIYDPKDSDWGGYRNSIMNKWFEQKFMPAMPINWKQMLKEVKFKTAQGYNSNLPSDKPNDNLVTSHVFFRLPTANELGYTIAEEVFTSEGAGTSIPWMSNNDARIKTMPNGQLNSQEEAIYWTASPDIKSANGNWYRVYEDGSVSLTGKDYWVDNTGNAEFGICPCFSI